MIDNFYIVAAGVSKNSLDDSTQALSSEWPAQTATLFLGLLPSAPRLCLSPLPTPLADGTPHAANALTSGRGSQPFRSRLKAWPRDEDVVQARRRRQVLGWPWERAPPSPS